MTNYVRVDPAAARAWTSQILERAKMSPPDANLVAAHLVEADLRGVFSHGLTRLPAYYARLQRGVTDPTGRPVVIESNESTALISGQNAMGQVVGDYAMGIAISKATTYGTGFVSVRESNHFGTCAEYVSLAIERQMIGIVATMGGKNIMAPWGGLTPLLGNNPIGIGVPTFDLPPFIFDIALSVAARGKIMLAAQDGQDIPTEWVVADLVGDTVDAKYAWANLLVRPIAAHKGYGLALAVALLSSVLSGAAFGPDVTDTHEDFSRPQNVGHMFLAIDPSRFMDVVEFRKAVDSAIRLMHGSELAPGFAEILVPGELEARSRARQMESGVEYVGAIVRDLNEFAQGIGADTFPVGLLGDADAPDMQAQ